MFDDLTHVIFFLCTLVIKMPWILNCLPTITFPAPITSPAECRAQLLLDILLHAPALLACSDLFTLPPPPSLQTMLLPVPCHLVCLLRQKLVYVDGYGGINVLDVGYEELVRADFGVAHRP